MYKIDRGIPFGRPSHTKYPFAEMRKGDSFLVPTGEANESSLGSAIHTYGKKLQAKFAKRKVQGGIRVWRIE